MLKWATTILGLGVFAYFGTIALHLAMGKRMMEHFSECHAELHIGEKIKLLDRQARDRALDEYGQCVVDHSASFDLLFFNKKDIGILIDAIKRDAAKKDS